jgi:exopolyphosphatase/guanosine-5'-triphosphate,3'-diphosphate pyrophosphatase
VETQEPIAIIDIGSNSVRLVVYSGPARAPTPIFNEKVLAGLGSGLARSGELSGESQQSSLAALRRYRLLLDYMRVKQTRVVATAAVRDALNGAHFARQVEEIGFDCEVLSAQDEARYAAEGVLSAIPGADGIVGDLGGGSLELADVQNGTVGKAISLPLGVLRIAGREKQALETLTDALRESGIGKGGAGRAFYMVGGSWRALAEIDMAATGFPLPVKHQYSMLPSRAPALRQLVAAGNFKPKKKIAQARLASSPAAATLLSCLADELGSNELVLSSFGIREGLLFSMLPPSERSKDPLIEAARHASGSEYRFGEHGDILDRWIGAVFDDPPAMSRLRRASCLLADAAWQSSPDFRADRGVEMALHGNWVGVDARDRVLMAQALSSNFGRDKLPDPSVTALCRPEELERARQWGLAMRLGQRLCGSVGAVLSSTSLAIDRENVRLTVRGGEAALVGEPVKRRLNELAEAMGRVADIAHR